LEPSPPETSTPPTFPEKPEACQRLLTSWHAKMRQAEGPMERATARGAGGVKKSKVALPTLTRTPVPVGTKDPIENTTSKAFPAVLTSKATTIDRQFWMTARCSYPE
jgi:hypothetical protein